MPLKVEPRIHSLRDGSRMQIREAERSDAAELLRYLDRVAGESDYLTFGVGEFELSQVEQELFVQSCLDSEHKLYLVAVVDGEIVGTMTFTAGPRPRTRHRGEFGLSVARRCWGTGVGSRLLDELIAWAERGGRVKKIDLHVREDNARAIALYERKGFVREGVLTRELFVAGRYYDLVAMGRWI